MDSEMIIKGLADCFCHFAPHLTPTDIELTIFYSLTFSLMKK